MKRPLQPVICWQPDTSAPQGGHWQYSDRKNQRLHVLDQHIRNTQAKASQRQSPNNRPAQTAPASPPPARILNHANVKPQTQAATTTAALRLSNAAWSGTRVPVGDSVHACFTAHDAQGGESATITLFETNADGSQTEVDTLSVALETGTKRYKIEWSRSEEEAQLDLQQDTEEGDTGPVSYTFDVTVAGQKATTTKPLNLTTTLVFKTTASFKHDLALIDADDKLHKAEVKQGELRFTNIPLGPWRLHSTTPWHRPPTPAPDHQSDLHFQHTARLTPKAAAPEHTLHHQPLFPPVIVNLREDAPAGDPCTRNQLTAEELDYFKQNGNNAVVFIHGFNVKYGEFGKLAGLTTQEGRFLEFDLPLIKEVNHWKILKPYYLKSPVTVYRDLNTLQRDFPAIKSTSPMELHRDFKDEEAMKEKLNGTGAHSWIVHLEHSLNRAAGMTGDDYSKYTRIIKVCWSGDAAGVPNYIESEFYASRAAGGLVFLLLQLIKAGIKVNLIAHSLGNRVLLHALDVLAKSGHKDAIEHAFMWQPACPDTALSNNPDMDTSVLGNWKFTHAHEAAKKFIVLYSSEDNVLGAYKNFNPMAFLEDVIGGKDKESLNAAEWGGLFGGSYGVATNVGIPPSFFFQPWAMQKVAQHRINNMTNKAINDINEDRERMGLPPAVTQTKETTVRPAMGWAGLERASEVDPFIKEKVKTGKFIPVDQSQWLFTHSGMKIPTEALFENVIKKEIMDKILTGGGFGNY